MIDIFYGAREVVIDARLTDTPTIINLLGHCALTLTIDLQDHGHILLLMVDFVGVHIKTNILQRISNIFGDMVTFCTKTLTSNLGKNLHFVSHG